jgi:uncharacterized membrane protein YhaH (DUF805 family)
MAARPRTVPIVAVFLFLAAAMAAIVGTSVLFPNRLMDRLWELNRPGAALFQAVGRVAGVFLLVLGGGSAAAGVGLLHGRKWAWWLAVALFVVDGTGDVVSFPFTRDLLRTAVGVAVSAAFLCSLTRPAARRYFDEPGPRR